MPHRVLLSPLARAGMAALVVIAALGASASPSPAITQAATSYTVSRTTRGIHTTLRFARRTYPQHALVAVTVTLRNISHANLGVARERLPYGPCSWPDVTLTSVNAQGQSVEPNPIIPPPAYPCAAPVPTDLPQGHAIVEHQLVELWSPRLQATGQAFNQVDDGFNRFAIR